MGVPRIRLALDAVECEVDADRLPRGADPLIDLGCTLRSAELRFDIRAPVDAFLRQARVELERMPAHQGPEPGIAFRIQ